MAWSAIKNSSSRRRDKRGDTYSRQQLQAPPCTLFFLDAARNISEGTEVKLEVSNITLGRGKDCVISFGEEFPMVSRMHASIEWSNNNFYLRHLSSTNQTLLNGRPISRKWFLQPGDVIQLAPSGPKIRFNPPDVFLEESQDQIPRKKVDKYFVALILVVAVSVALLGWLVYLMFFES